MSKSFCLKNKKVAKNKNLWLYFDFKTLYSLGIYFVSSHPRESKIKENKKEFIFFNLN